MMVHRKHRKGQALVIEEIIFIGIGIMLLVSIGFIFNSMSARASDDVGNIVIKEVAYAVTATADKLAIYNTRGSIVVDIPNMINNNAYYIEGYGNNMIRVRTREMVATVNVTAPVTGTAHSSYGKVTVSYNGSHIILRGGVY